MDDMKDLRDLLDETIVREIENLNSMDSGSDEHSKAVESLNKLYKLKIEEDKNKQDHLDKQEAITTEERNLKLKRDQLSEQVKDRYINCGVQVGLALLSVFAYDQWYRRGLKFEETGSVTSPWIRNIISKMVPKK